MKMKNIFVANALAIFVEFLILSNAAAIAHERSKDSLEKRHLSSLLANRHQQLTQNGIKRHFSSLLKCGTIVCKDEPSESHSDPGMTNLYHIPPEEAVDVSLLDYFKRLFGSNEENLPTDKRFFASLLKDDGFTDQYLPNEKRHLSSVFKDKRRHLASVIHNWNDFGDESKLVGSEFKPYVRNNLNVGPAYDADENELHLRELRNNIDEIASRDGITNDLLRALSTAELTGNDRYSQPTEKRHIGSILDNKTYMKRHISSILKARILGNDHRNFQDNFSFEPAGISEIEKRHISSIVRNMRSDENKEYIPDIQQNKIIKREVIYPIIDNTEKNGKISDETIDGVAKRLIDKDNRLTTNSNDVLFNKDKKDSTRQTLSRKKRYVGALARNNNLPFRRDYVSNPDSLQSVPVRPMVSYNSDEDSPILQIGKYERPDIYPKDAIGYFPSPQKRFLGSLARQGWFPRQYRSYVEPGINGASPPQRSSEVLVYADRINPSRFENYGSAYVPNGYLG